jgi:dienelactone hydrolase
MTISRNDLAALFGIEPLKLELRSRQVTEAGDHAVERLQFALGPEPVRGILTRPLDEGPHPAILYAHAHGGNYAIGASELIEGRAALLSPLGPVFARAGYVSLCIDMPTFGERANVKESALAKALLWYGRSLAGQMLSEQAAALGYLIARDDVVAGRVGMFGLSMGATLAYWLAAVDERISAVAHLCCYADFAGLVATGAHDRHGIYLSVPGLLARTSTGEIAGLVAPRPQLICVGGDDPLTPPATVDAALAATMAAYRSGPLQVLRQTGIGHRETTEMREAVLAFFGGHWPQDRGPRP